MATTKKRRTQAERTEASDKAMFRAAIKLIAKEGPSTMTLARLGKEAGFSGGLVSYRFGSKSKLLQATAERILQLWSDRVIAPAHSQNEGIEFIKTTAKLYLDAVVDGSDLMVAQYRLMNESYSSYKELQPAFQKYDKQVRDMIIKNLKPAQEKGEIAASVDLKAFSVLFTGMIRGIAVQYFIDNKAFDIKAAYKLVELTCDRILVPA